MIPDHLYPLTQKLSGARLCIFDFDGTLVNLEQLNYDSVVKVTMRHLNKKIDTDYYQECTAGADAATGLKRIFEHLSPGSTERYDVYDLRKEYRSYKRVAIDGDPAKYAQLIRGADDYLSLLRKRNYRLAIASASTREFIDKLLKHFGVFDYFEMIVASEDVSVSKPDPESYEKVLSHFHISKDEVVAYEDSRNGIRSAKGAGLYTVGIHNPGWNDSFIWDMSDITVSDYRECVEALPRSLIVRC